MKYKLRFTLAVLLTVGALGQMPLFAGDTALEVEYIQSMLDTTRDAGELAGLAGGSAGLEINSIPGGTSYLVHVDTPNVTGVRLQKPGAEVVTDSVYVSISASESLEPSDHAPAMADVVVDGESLHGKYEVRVEAETPSNLNLVIETSSGDEIVWVLTSPDGLAGKELALDFDVEALSSQSYVIDCSETNCRPAS